jgi:hypothetical protein
MGEPGQGIARQGGFATVSPLAQLLMKVLRAACWAAAVLLAVIIGVHGWKIAQSAGADTVAARGDYVLAGIMVAMFVGAVWLALAIGRELKNHPAPPG